MKRTTSIYSETLDRDVSVEFEIFWNEDPRTEEKFRDFTILDIDCYLLCYSEVEKEVTDYLKENLAEYIEDDTDLFNRD
jgi:hypothetical protein